MEIEIHKIIDRGDHYFVSYSYEGSNVSHTIRRVDLIEFIVEQGLNVLELWDYKLDDLIQSYGDPSTLLDDDYHSVITNYLKHHLS